MANSAAEALQESLHLPEVNHWTPMKRIRMRNLPYYSTHLVSDEHMHADEFQDCESTQAVVPRAVDVCIKLSIEFPSCSSSWLHLAS